MNEESEKISEKNSNEINNKFKSNNSMMSIENNPSKRKNSKIKTLKRLNLDLPDELINNDNVSQTSSMKPLSKNQVIESYQDLTHRSLFYPKPLKVENMKKNLSSTSNHLANLKEPESKINNEDEINQNEKYFESERSSNKEKDRANEDIENNEDNQDEKENEQNNNNNEEKEEEENDKQEEEEEEDDNNNDKISNTNNNINNEEKEKEKEENNEDIEHVNIVKPKRDVNEDKINNEQNMNDNMEISENYEYEEMKLN